MPPDREPTQDELMAMAYADGELPVESRRTFEARMLHEPALARLVAEHRALEILGRRAAPPEPIDSEWRRLDRDPLVRWTELCGWALFIAGGVGLALYGIYQVWLSDMESLPKTLVLATIAGFLLLFLVMVHARLATLPFDPYRNVER